jgi:hypothetical protein
MVLRSHSQRPRKIRYDKIDKIILYYLISQRPNPAQLSVALGPVVGRRAAARHRARLQIVSVIAAHQVVRLKGGRGGSHARVGHGKHSRSKHGHDSKRARASVTRA